MTVVLVVMTILAFLALDWIVLGRREREEIFAYARRRGNRAPDRVRLPGGVFFAPSHTWLNLFPSGKVVLGVDDFVGRLLQKPRVALLKQSGEAVAKGEPIIRLSSGDHALTVRSPIEGEIVAPNLNLIRSPGLMREALFSDGWAYVMRPGQPQQLKGMLLGEECQGWMRAELARLKELLTNWGGRPDLAPAALPDGGIPVAGVMQEMDEPVWKRFEEEFLQVK